VGSRDLGNIGLEDEQVMGVPFATNPHPMWIYDLTTLAFLKVNEAAIQTYGFTNEEFLKMTVLDIRPHGEIPRFLHSWKHPHASTAEKWCHIGKAGKPFPVSITSWQLIFQGRKAELVLARRES
jgi:hypothetical protein